MHLWLLHGMRYGNNGMTLHCESMRDSRRQLPSSVPHRTLSRGNRQRRGELLDTVEISVSMKVTVVTQNVERIWTSLMAHAELLSIFSYVLMNLPCPYCASQASSFLRFVKLCRTRTSPLPGLEASMIPVEPVSRSYGIRYTTSQAAHIPCRV
ncbi:hypothetical protein EDD17DRAFT_1093533 [Pisolithus thermaeus]|nr:hypothetical protein EDD17DRAFT_1093533 [Pisolithus thermaeus]